jgi:hypothetical protein
LFSWFRPVCCFSGKCPFPSGNIGKETDILHNNCTTWAERLQQTTEDYPVKVDFLEGYIIMFLSKRSVFGIAI